MEITEVETYVVDADWAKLGSSSRVRTDEGITREAPPGYPCEPKDSHSLFDAEGA